MQLLSAEEKEKFHREFKEALPTFCERVANIARTCNDDNSNHGRRALSAAGFLWEDFVKDHDDLHLLWRIFINGNGMEQLERTITTLADDFSDNYLAYFVDDEVSMSHNWWRTINRGFDWAKNLPEGIHFYNLDCNPSLPQLAAIWQMSAVDYALRERRRVIDCEAVLVRYFSLSTISRLHRQHPLSMFTHGLLTDGVPAERLVNAIKAMDRQILDILSSNKDPKLLTADLVPLEESGCIENLKKMRSAIEFLEEEFVPHCEEAQEPWKLFRESEAVNELEMVLENPDGRKTSGQEAMDLRMVGDNHWWFSKEDREKSEKMYGAVPVRQLVPFTLHSIEVEKKRVICSMLKLWIYNDPTLGTDFLFNYFRFSKRIRSLSKDSIDFLTQKDIKELRFTLCSSAESLNRSLLTLCNHPELEKNLWRLRGCRSAIEFLEEEIVDHEIKDNWNAFLNGDGCRKMNERLEEFEGKRSGEYLEKYGYMYPNDLRGVPTNHVYWSEEDRRISEQEYGKRGWSDNYVHPGFNFS